MFFVWCFQGPAILSNHKKRRQRSFNILEHEFHYNENQILQGVEQVLIDLRIVFANQLLP